MEISEKIKKIENYFAKKYMKTIDEYFDVDDLLIRNCKPKLLKTAFIDNALYLILDDSYNIDVVRFRMSAQTNDLYIMNAENYMTITRHHIYGISNNTKNELQEYSDEHLFEFIKEKTFNFSSRYLYHSGCVNASNYKDFLYETMYNCYALTKCVDCGKLIHTYNGVVARNEINKTYYSCRECADKYYERCDCCLCYHKKEELTALYDDHKICNSCLQRNYVVSDAFDENHKILKNSAIHISDFGYVCKKSIKEHSKEIVKCSLCGAYVKIENSKVINKKRICSSCLSDKHTEIKGYHTNPRRAYFYDDKVSLTPRKFKGFGLELEVQKTDEGSTDKAREEIKKILGDDPYQKLYFMRDGSIGSSGFEIITQPHSEKDLLKINWENILSKLVSLGYRSHNGNACGLHIHSSRSLYGDTKAEQDDNIAKVIYFYEKNFDDLFKFSRRTETHWCKPYKETLRGSYLGRMCGYNGDMDKSVCKEILRHTQNRYQTVNITNKNTIEFRIFRGTLCLNSFLSALDLTFNIVRNCKDISWDDIDDTSKWLNGINDTTRNYIKRRNCFVEVIR